MTDKRKADLALDADPVAIHSTDPKAAEARRRGHGFAPWVFAAILLVGGLATYTFLQSNGNDAFTARNGWLEQGEPATN